MFITTTYIVSGGCCFVFIHFTSLSCPLLLYWPTADEYWRKLILTLFYGSCSCSLRLSLLSVNHVTCLLFVHTIEIPWQMRCAREQQQFLLELFVTFWSWLVSAYYSTRNGNAKNSVGFGVCAGISWNASGMFWLRMQQQQQQQHQHPDEITLSCMCYICTYKQNTNGARCQCTLQDPMFIARVYAFVYRTPSIHLYMCVWEHRGIPCYAHHIPFFRTECAHGIRLLAGGPKSTQRAPQALTHNTNKFKLSLSLSLSL